MPFIIISLINNKLARELEHRGRGQALWDGKKEKANVDGTQSFNCVNMQRWLGSSTLYLYSTVFVTLMLFCAILN